MTILEATRGVTGGVDTHLDVHVATALDPLGALLGTESFRTDPTGYKALVAWLESFGVVTKVGVEGTGSYGTGLARFLRRAGPHVGDRASPIASMRSKRPVRRSVAGPRAFRSLKTVRSKPSGYTWWPSVRRARLG
jgi:transposase